MLAPQFDIVFCGVRSGFDPSLVKAQFAQLFKLDPAKVERIFKSSRVTLKTNADERLANIFVARLFAIGVMTDKLPVQLLPSRAICSPDHGEVSAESHSMHQSVEFLFVDGIRRVPFMFDGTGWNYCKIWLVNILVCLLSAGILYPWAQIRSVRYFYENTHFDYTEFIYTSRSQKVFLVQFILIIYVIVLCYTFLYSPWLCAAGAILLLAVLPYYWLKRSVSQLRHSFFGDAFFQRNTNLIEAYKVCLLWPFLGLVTAGLAAPYAAYRIQQHRAQSVSIGGISFIFSAAFKPYLSLLPVLLIAEVVSGICFYYRTYLPVFFTLLLIAALWLQVFVRWRVALRNLQWSFTTTKLGHFVSTWDVRGYNKLVTKNILLCLVTAGFYWPWARVNSARYKAEHLAFFANQRFKKWRKKLT